MHVLAITGASSSIMFLQCLCSFNTILGSFKCYQDGASSGTVLVPVFSLFECLYPSSYVPHLQEVA